MCVHLLCLVSFLVSLSVVCAACIPDEPTHFELVQVMQLILGKFRSWHILIHTLGIPEHIEQEILQVCTAIIIIINDEYKPSCMTVYIKIIAVQIIRVWKVGCVNESLVLFQDTPGVKTQILKILNTWKMLHQNDGTCTRANLAAILRQTDVSLLPAARALESPRQPWP